VSQIAPNAREPRDWSGIVTAIADPKEGLQDTGAHTGRVPTAGWLNMETTTMCALIAFLLLTAVLFGAGFALHVLWWIALVALGMSLIGLAFRPRGRRWPRR